MTDTTHHYYAVPDPLDPAKVSFWYTPRRGREQGKLKPWPPQRNRWGFLFYKDMPDGRADTAANRQFRERFFQRVRQARIAVRDEIDADPERAAARFGRYCIACCFCGKALYEKRSKVYGIGPECRAGLPASLLSHAIELAKQVYAEPELARPEIPT